MSRNGSGTQTSPGGSFPAVTGTVISSTSFNNIVNDINSEITKSIANDGQTPITANLPMSGFKHTGVAAASGSGQYMEYAQVNTLLAAKAANGANSDITSLSAVTSINGGQIAGLRNRIINGAMAVDQRNAGASQTITAGAALAYTVDRFYAYCTGANVTGQQVAGQIANTYRYQFTGAASVTGVGFGTRLEAVNTADLAGSTATLSVKLKSSSLTSITWTAYYANTKDTFGTLASPTRTQIATGTFTITSTEATYSAQISVGAAATTGIEIVLTGGALLGTQTLTIGDIQLERGSTSSSFEQRPVGLELALCQRFYYAANEAVSAGAYAGGSTTLFIQYYLPVSMRSNPTISAAWGSGTNANAGSFTALSSRVCQSSISPVSTPAAFSAVATWTSFTAEL